MKAIFGLIFAVGCAQAPALDSGFAADDKLAASATSCVGQCWATWLTDLDACNDDFNTDRSACWTDYYDDLDSLKDSDSFPYDCRDLVGFELHVCLRDYCSDGSDNNLCDAVDAIREQRTLCENDATNAFRECEDDADAARDACIADCKNEADAQVSGH